MTDPSTGQSDMAVSQPGASTPRAPLGLPRNVWIMTLTSTFTDISSEMILNLVPLFLANVLHAPTSIIGLIEGIAETTASLIKGASGWLSDRLRTRKWLAVLGYGLSAFSKPLLYMATAWTSVFGVRFADRVGKGIRTAPRDALLADSVAPDKRGLAFGLHRAGDTAGAVIGLGIALIVVLSTGAQAVTLDRPTFQTLVLLSAIPAFIGVIILARWAKDVPIKPRAGQETRPVRLTLGAMDRRFRYLLLTVGVFTLGNSADAFLVLRAQERGLTIAGILGMLITFSAVYALLSGPAGALSDRIGRRRLITFGWITYAALYLGFALAQMAAAVWILYALYGVYYASVEGVAKALIADIVPSEQRGAAYGYYNAAIGLIALPASLLAGMLWQLFGPSAPFLGGGALALTAVVLLTLWNRKA